LSFGSKFNSLKENNMRGRILAIVIGLAISIVGFYLVVKWWEGSMWQLALSGAMALGGLGAAWSGIKGETKTSPKQTGDNQPPKQQ
jgi:hypothetical protein